MSHKSESERKRPTLDEIRERTYLDTRWVDERCYRYADAAEVATRLDHANTDRTELLKIVKELEQALHALSMEDD